jgi:hypothetical protein
MTKLLGAPADARRTALRRVVGKAGYVAGLVKDRLAGGAGPEINAIHYTSGVAAILAQKAARDSFRHLWDAEVSVYSQWGEDGILDYLCDALNLAKPRALELGVGNYTECNTRFLAQYRAASVVAVDGRKDLARTVEALGLGWKTKILALEEWITPQSVVGICQRARDFMGAIDILSLDIDGNDYWVAKELDLESVQVIVVEYNPVFGGVHPLTVPRNDQFDRTKAHFSWLYYGASLRAFIDLFDKSGYVLVGTNRVGNNAFFVRQDLAPLVNLDRPDIENLAVYVDWRVRESRDARGELSYLSDRARERVIEDLPMVNILTGQTSSFAESLSQ